jgi:TrmH family RNA methyltransferase
MSQQIKDTNYTLTPFDKVRIVMVNTTEPGNIGAGARAMKNMALSRLYLVNPSNFPSAVATAGASARQRSMKWRQLDVVDSCAEIQKTLEHDGQEVAVIFGTERSGLTNDELDLCHILMTIPGNPEYFSLNVASAIQVFAYQYFVCNSQTNFESSENTLASFGELEGFYKHLEQVLEHIEYFEEKRPRPLLMRRLRRLFGRAQPEQEEVAILRGILRNIKHFEKG